MRNPLDKSFFDGVDDAFEMRLIDTPIGAGLMGLEQVQALAKAKMQMDPTRQIITQTG